jgi:dienelactone hydrolase
MRSTLLTGIDVPVVDGDLCHDVLASRTSQELGYRSDVSDVDAWGEKVREKFYELTGMKSVETNTCPLDFCIEESLQKDGYTQLRFSFYSETGARVPCYLLIPDTGKEKYPVAITLQGHYKGGVYGSLGEIREESDKNYQPRGAFAVQAVRNGFIALAIEQRAMGERAPKKELRTTGQMCSYPALVAFMLGRTTVAERIWDVHKAIDVLANFPQCDLERIVITGNSGGGTTAFYAACYDSRIKLCVPSCAFCQYLPSILDKVHCACNYIPRAYQYFDMQDLSVLIAPRKLLIIAGEQDAIFPIDGVRKGFETVQAIFRRKGVEKNCRLVTTPKHHYWCEDIVWAEILTEMERI